MSKRVVHLSNEQGEIEVETLKDKVRVFDIPKALKLFQDNNHKHSIEMGMLKDRFWTAQTVETEDEIKNFPLMTTDWDTPTVWIDGKPHDCYITLDKSIVDTLVTYGINKQKTRQSLSDFVEKHKS